MFGISGTPFLFDSLADLFNYLIHLSPVILMMHGDSMITYFGRYVAWIIVVYKDGKYYVTYKDFK